MEGDLDTDSGSEWEAWRNCQEGYAYEEWSECNSVISCYGCGGKENSKYGRFEEEGAETAENGEDY